MYTAYYVATIAKISEVLHVAGEKGSTGASAEYAIQEIFRFLAPDSLRSVVRLRRAVPAYGRGGNFLEDTRKTLSKEEIRPRRAVFP